MPEGPEVEIVKLGLQSIIGMEITNIKISKNKKYYPNSAKYRMIKGSRLNKIERIGKFMIWKFKTNNREISFLNHLGMTGTWNLYSDDIWNEFNKPFVKFKHYKLYFSFSDGSHLLFVDPRTFGRFEPVAIDQIYSHKSIRDVGPDILDINFDIHEFIKRIRGKNNRKRIEIGKALLDYKIIAGCGNIYKSESLYLARINPFTPVNLLTERDLIKLSQKLGIVANIALKNKGTTLRDYHNVDGYSGLMQNKLLIYDHEGEACSNCDTMIIKARQGDRSSYYCPNCQKLKKY